MATFTQVFRPALNRDGYAKLTFLGSSSQSGNTNGKDWEVFKLHFEVQGVVRGVNQKIQIVTNFAYGDDNLLGRSLKAMGFKPELQEGELIEDESGFMVMPVSEDDEGFETANEQVPDIEGFLKHCEGKVYVAKVQKVTEGKRKGFWEIDVDTLKPFVKG